VSEDNGHRRIDLDQIRAARREKLGPAPVLRFDRKEFELPLEMPADYGLAWMENRYASAVRALIGDEAAAEFFTWATIPDLWAFGTEVDTLYGFGQGEAPASPAS
jgi:hypothetical protein